MSVTVIIECDLIPQNGQSRLLNQLVAWLVHEWRLPSAGFNHLSFIASVCDTKWVTVLLAYVSWLLGCVPLLVVEIWQCLPYMVVFGFLHLSKWTLPVHLLELSESCSFDFFLLDQVIQVSPFLIHNLLVIQIFYEHYTIKDYIVWDRASQRGLWTCESSAQGCSSNPVSSGNS